MIEELILSIETSDPLGVLAILHPSERLLIKSIYDTVGETAESTGSVDVGRLLTAVDVGVDLVDMQIEQLTDGLAWATADSSMIDLRFDSDAAAAATTLDRWSIGSARASYEVRPAYYSIGVALVREGDRWFASALYSAAELARRDLRLPARFAPQYPAPAGADTPVEAVNAFLAAISTKDVRALASSLSRFEGRLIADYETTVIGELLAEVSAISVGVSARSMSVVEQTGESAIVEVDAWSFALDGPVDRYDDVDQSIRLDVTGLCGEASWVNTWANRAESGAACAFNESTGVDVVSILADRGWRGPRFVVIDEGDGWSVSLARTALETLRPFASDVFTTLDLVSILFWLGDEPYDLALEAIASQLEPAPMGTVDPAWLGEGRVAVFRVTGPASVDIGVTTGYCWGYGLNISDDGYEYTNCQGPLRLGEGDWAFLVSGSSFGGWSGTPRSPGCRSSSSPEPSMAHGLVPPSLVEPRHHTVAASGAQLGIGEQGSPTDRVMTSR